MAKIWWKATKSILFISFLTKFGHKIIYVFLHTIFRPTLLPVGLQISPSYSIPSSGTSVGLMILEICWGFANSGLRPPCMQKILSSIIAETGRQLKTSENTFQSLILYLLLPLANSLGVVRAGFDGLCSHKFKLNSKSSLSFFFILPPGDLKKIAYIHHRIHRVCWWMSIRGFLWGGRSFLGTWPCKQRGGRWSPSFIFLCQHNLQGRDNLTQVGNLRIQKLWADHNIAHGYHLEKVSIKKQKCLTYRRSWGELRAQGGLVDQ